MSPSLSYYHPANCPFSWLPWQHGENSWNQTSLQLKDIWGHSKWGWEKSVCFTTKTVKLCRPTAAAAQLRVYFKFRLTSKRVDKPTVNTVGSMDLMYAWPMTTCPLSLSQLSLFLSWLIRTSVRPNTDRFMTWWFLAMPWVSLSTYLLRSGVGSASACHLSAFVISSACAWMYCTADSIEKKAYEFVIKLIRLLSVQCFFLFFFWFCQFIK